MHCDVLKKYGKEWRYLTCSAVTLPIKSLLRMAGELFV